MEHRLGKARSGLSLIEVMLAVTVIAVGVLGAMMFRYVTVLDARKADIQVGAGRVALLILEGWKGAAGAEVGVGTEYSPAEDIPLSGNGVSYRIYITGTNPYNVLLTGGTATRNSTVTLTRLPQTGNNMVSAIDITGDGVPDPGLVKLTVEATSSARPVKLSDFVRTN